MLANNFSASCARLNPDFQSDRAVLLFEIEHQIFRSNG